MELKKFIAHSKISAADLAKQLQVASNCVGRYLSGERTPRPSVMRRIFTVTEGKVTPNDLILTEEQRKQIAEDHFHNVSYFTDKAKGQD